MASNVRFRCFNHDMDCNCCILYRILLGSLLGIIRTLPNKPLALIGDTYVEIFRNIPLIVQLFFWAFVFPELLPATLSSGSGEVVAGGWWKNLLNDHPAVIGVLHSVYILLRVYQSIFVPESTRYHVAKNLQHLQWVLPQAKVIAM